MKIKDRLESTEKPTPVTLRQSDSVQAALDVMCQKNIGSVIITDEDMTIKGIVTERDMMKRVLAAGKNPTETKISGIMSEDIMTANLDDDLMDWFKVMSHERFRHLPVVDKDGRLVNILSQGDFVAHTYPDLYEKVSSDLQGRLSRILQLLLIIGAVVTLYLIAVEL